MRYRLAILTLVTGLLLSGCSTSDSTKTLPGIPGNSKVDLCREIQGVMGQYSDLFLSGSGISSPTLEQLTPIINNLEELIPQAKNGEQKKYIENLVEDFKLIGNPDTTMQGLGKFSADALKIGVVCNP